MSSLPFLFVNTFISYYINVLKCSCHINRDIVQYLRHKASPTVRRVSSMAEITPYLDQFETGEMHEQGLFSIVLGLFMPRDENDPAKVSVCMVRFLV